MSPRAKRTSRSPQSCTVVLGGQRGLGVCFPEQAQVMDLQSTKGRRRTPLAEPKLCSQHGQLQSSSQLWGFHPSASWSGDLTEEGPLLMKLHGAAPCWRQQAPPPPAPLLSWDGPREGSQAQPTTDTNPCPPSHVFLLQGYFVFICVC